MACRNDPRPHTPATGTGAMAPLIITWVASASALVWCGALCQVRECLTVLDLDALVYPCPRETLKAYGVCKDSRFRPVRAPFLQGLLLPLPTRACRFVCCCPRAFGFCKDLRVCRVPGPFNPTACLPRVLARHRCVRTSTHSRPPTTILARPRDEHNTPSCTPGVQEVIEMGGKAMFPYLVDDNNGTRMYGSDDIVAYLATTYGAGVSQGPVKAEPPRFVPYRNVWQNEAAAP